MSALTELLLAPQNELEGRVLALLLALHLLVSLLAGALATWVVRSGVEMRRRRWQFFALTSLVALTMPGLGLVGVALAFVPGFRRRAARPPQPLLAFEVPDLPYAPEPYRPTLGSLREMLYYARDAEAKRVIVGATRNMSDRESVPLLRLLLLDPDDEIRLMAYAILDRKEARLTGQIYRLEQRLGVTHKAAAKARLELRLAQCYWELVYVGLAENDLRLLYLGRAREHARLAVDLAMALDDPLEARLLFGRILVALGEAEAARVELEAARAAGATEEQTLPYLAETAFLERRLDAVREQLGTLGESSRYPDLNELKVFWA